MIIARIFGGLGNQLFIYYSAKSLAIKNNSKLIIDHKSGYLKDKYNRTFLLNKIVKLKKEDYISDNSILLKKTYVLIRNFNKIINLILPTRLKYYYKDYNKFNKNYKYLRKRLYLDSYLQFYSYFHEIKNMINEDFDKLNLKYFQFTKLKNNDVAICFRSFEEVKKNTKLDWEYYNNSIKYFLKIYGSVKLHIYTDDKNFVYKNYYNQLKKYKIKFSKNYNDPVKTLMELSNFQNIIISKSTFHWWGAYINDEKKIVFAPRKINNNNYYPEYWKVK